MDAASRHPDRVRGLVIAGATAEPAGPARHAFRAFAWALAAVPLRPFDRLNTWFFRRRYVAEVAEGVVRGGYWTRGGAAAVRELISPAGATTSFRDRLLAYGGPILVINGDLDLLFRLGARSFLRGIPGVRRRLLRRTTHLSPFDSPREFAAAVRDFASSLPA
jgi:pimeloyl-ACP methyl ester carboxylesterase